MRDSHPASYANFSPSKVLLVGLLGMVLGGASLGRSDSLLLSSDLLSPGGPAGDGVVLVVSCSR